MKTTYKFALLIVIGFAIGFFVSDTINVQYQNKEEEIRNIETQRQFRVTNGWRTNAVINVTNNNWKIAFSFTN